MSGEYTYIVKYLNRDTKQYLEVWGMEEDEALVMMDNFADTSGFHWVVENENHLRAYRRVNTGGGEVANMIIGDLQVQLVENQAPEDYRIPLKKGDYVTAKRDIDEMDLTMNGDPKNIVIGKGLRGRVYSYNGQTNSASVIFEDRKTALIVSRVLLHKED